MSLTSRGTALITALLASAALVTGCSEQTSDDIAGGGELNKSQRLTAFQVADTCKAALDDLLTSYNYNHTYLSLLSLDVPELGPDASEFDGELKGNITSPHYRGDFTFSCYTDGRTANVDNVNLPRPETSQPTSQTQAAPPPAAPPPAAPTAKPAPVDPGRIDPKNDPSGKSGKDDDLGIYYHNLSEWRWLETPNVIGPGVRIYNASSGGGCSAGFIASTGDRLFIVTAGHCGRQGDQFYIQNAQGQQYVFGEMVESYFDHSKSAVTGVDIGLIEIYSDAKQYVNSALPTSYKLQGWTTPQDAANRNMMFCRLGATTGYSCGKFEEIANEGLFYFRNISDRGDSGGAIFALDQSGAWAVGVTSNVSDYNKTYLGGMEIAGAMQYWGLTLHG